MIDLIKIGAAFGLIVLLLRLRLNLGATMASAAVLLGALYGIGPLSQGKIFLAAAMDPVTVSLIAALALIMVLENIIRKTGLLARMTDSLVQVSGDRRIAMAVLPGVIGLLPSAGGAAFSAPLVQSASARADIPPARMAFINYWFRHIWEYISPLYPGIVLAAAITATPLTTLIHSQLPLPVAVVVAGVLLGFRGMTNNGADRTRRDWAAVRTLFVSLLPIIASLVLVVGFKVRLSLAMAGICVVMFALYRYSPRRILTTLRESLSLNILLMVIGIMVFKGMIESSGAISALPPFFERSGLPPAVILALLPFLVGLLTGLTVGFVGAAFPIITALYVGAPPPEAVTFAFACGFAGVMLSPTHLCLVLTVRYFKADMAQTYRLLYAPVLIVLSVGLINFLLH